MKNIEILIPSWPETRDSITKIGCSDYGQPWGGIDSFRFQFRAKQTCEGYLPEYQYRCWMDIGMTIFVHSDGRCSIEIRAQEVHSADLNQLEHLVKCLKWVSKRLDQVSSAGLKLESLPFYLTNLCNALGIKRTIQYHGVAVPETYAPVSEALQIIVGECRRRHERMAA